MPEQKQVHIAGAGIAGMSTALALAAKGIKAILLEKAPRPDEVGAGLQLAPNATCLLRAWGVLDNLYDHAVEPDGIDLKDGTSGKTLMHMNVQAISRKRWKAPYITVHRADLQTALKTAIDKNPLIDFKTGYEITSCSGSSNSGFEAEIIQGKIREKISGLLLASCDGVWSQMRANLSEQAVFSGYVAWRATLALEEIPATFLQTNGLKTVGVWTGKNGHFVAYPLKNGKVYNFVAIIHGQNPGPVWSKDGDNSILLDSFRDWYPAITDVINHVRQWTFWPLFKMPFPRFLGPSGEIFLGDASHAVTPFAAQGAAMAIEDAAAFAAALSDINLTRAEALALFKDERCKRLKAVARRGDFNRFVYHVSGPLAFARNLVMKIRPAEKFLTDLDWLYGYDATRFLPEVA